MNDFFKLNKLFTCCLLFLGINNWGFAGAIGGPYLQEYNNNRMSYEAIKPKRLQTFDISALNLKDTPQQHSAARMNEAISIGFSDFNTISAIGNTWLMYRKDKAGISMNIGSANSTSPQTWTLPANLLATFSGVGRSDFVSTNSVPSALRVTGANKVMQTYYFDNNNRVMSQYDHFSMDNTKIEHLGTSYDLEVGEDDNFGDEPDYKYADVPFNLGENYSTTIEEKDYVSNQTLTKYVQSSTVDAFGTISTPDGVYNCLRSITTSQRYTRPDVNTAYTLQTYTWVSFVTKEGLYFKGVVSGSSGTVNINFFEYRKVVPTASLTETSDVKLSNDSKGVTINNDNSIAHPSAILDVKSDSLGILIPRIAKVNRPKSPATGLLVYQIDNTPGFYYYDGSAWRVLGSSPSARIAADENSFSINGTTQLSNGTTFIKFDHVQENPENLIINLQLEGDCNGLYISQKTKEGFLVKELKGGKSNVKFSWSVKLD